MTRIDAHYTEEIQRLRELLEASVRMENLHFAFSESLRAELLKTQLQLTESQEQVHALRKETEWLRFLLESRTRHVEELETLLRKGAE